MRDDIARSLTDMIEALAPDGAQYILEHGWLRLTVLLVFLVILIVLLFKVFQRPKEAAKGAAEQWLVFTARLLLIFHITFLFLVRFGPAGWASFTFDFIWIPGMIALPIWLVARSSYERKKHLIALTSVLLLFFLVASC